MPPKFLTLAEVLEFHEDLIREFGGSPGVRDLGLAESALAMPQGGAGDGFFHAFPFEMAAAYLYHIAQNHPFVDGNKRTGASSSTTRMRGAAAAIARDHTLITVNTPP